MPTEAQLWQEFEKYMRSADEKADVSIGKKDKRGNLFVLGGHQANIWRLKDGLYSVAGEKVPSGQEAVELYNSHNGATLRTDYISAVFYPWYEKQFKVIASVPSDSRPGVTYEIVRTPDGELLCDPRCEGFRYRHDCSHVRHIKKMEQEAK